MVHPKANVNVDLRGVICGLLEFHAAHFNTNIINKVPHHQL